MLSSTQTKTIYPYKMQEDLTVIIPVYNEQKTITTLLEKLFSILKNSRLTYQVIIVDDGSTDDTKKILRKFQNEKKTSCPYELILHEKNQGKGAAIHSAIKKANGQYTIIQDADMEYNPSDIIGLYNHAKEKNLRVIYGSRNKGNNKRGTFIFYWGGRLVTFFTNLLFRQKLTDEATCYKLIDTKLLQSFPLKEKGFAFCPEVTACLAKEKIRIEEIPISYSPRSKEQGKKINWRDGLKAISTLFLIRFPNINIHLLALLVSVITFLLYATTWHVSFEGYEGETVNAALKLFSGDYEVKRAGISALLLYMPFIFVYELFGGIHIPILSIAIITYSAITGGLLFYIVWYLTKKKSISLIVPLIIISATNMWPYANIGMEYQAMFYLTLLLFLLLRWKEKKSSLFWPAIIFALLCTAKSYGPVFGLPMVLFIFFASQKDNFKKNIFLSLIPAAIIFPLYLAIQYYTSGSGTGWYSLRQEFQIWTWWEGFYGVFFSIGKGILIFNPILILALFKWRQFIKEHKETAVFILCSFLLLFLITAPFSFWADETPGIRKLIPIIGLLNLPLIYYFSGDFFRKKIQALGILSIIFASIYIQILLATYNYGDHLKILRDGNLDSLHHMRFTPELSQIPVFNKLLTGFVFNKKQELTYKEESWGRLSVQRSNLFFDSAKIDLSRYQTPEILWFKDASHCFFNCKFHMKDIFWLLTIIDLLLISFATKYFLKYRRFDIA